MGNFCKSDTFKKSFFSEYVPAPEIIFFFDDDNRSIENMAQGEARRVYRVGDVGIIIPKWGADARGVITAYPGQERLHFQKVYLLRIVWNISYIAMDTTADAVRRVCILLPRWRRKLTGKKKTHKIIRDRRR